MPSFVPVHNNFTLTLYYANYQGVLAAPFNGDRSTNLETKFVHFLSFSFYQLSAVRGIYKGRV